MRKRALAGIIGIVLCVIIALVLLWPTQKSASQAELSYYRQKISSIKTAVETVQAENRREIQDSQQLKNIEVYQAALSSGLSSCQQIEDRKNNKDAAKKLQDYNDEIDQFQLFCKDYIDVFDHALKSSRATRQFISTDTSDLTELKEILGYTKTDLEKLKSSPLSDPGIGEQITTVDALQNRIQQVQDGGSAQGAEQLIAESKVQRANIVTARNYFWNNTVHLDAIQRSISRIQTTFDDKSNP